MRLSSVILTLLCACGIALGTETTNHPQTAASLQGNELLLPSNYRSWVAVSPSAPGMPDHQHHHVASKLYVEPTAYDAFMKNGLWPNHTVIVLELRKDSKKPVATKLKCNLMGLEVAMKDDSRTPDPWTYYGIIYDGKDPAAAKSEYAASGECANCGDSEMDMRLAMYLPALRAIIHAKPWMMTPTIF